MTRIIRIRRLGRIPSSRCQEQRRIDRGETVLFDVGRFPSEGLVEPDGIEPTTSCLQSRRSPN
jgi:hypothetical protein